MENREKDRQFVEALARGLDVLRCFRNNDNSLSNAEIASRTGLAKPTVSRLTYTLTELDYLKKDAFTGHYRLGAGVLTLGHGVLASMSFGDLAAEEMQKLCKGPNAYVTCSLGERYKHIAVVTAVQRTHQAVSMTLRIGAGLPLFRSSLGRAILVAMLPNKREAVVKREIERKPEFAREIEKAMFNALNDFEKYGFCTAFGTWSDEVNGIAIPVRAPDDGRLCAINIGGPSFLVKTDELLDWYGNALKQAARNIGGGVIK